MRSLKILMMVCILLLSVSIRAEDKALLIGIGDYEAAPDLPGIQKDVSMMKDCGEKTRFSKCAGVVGPTGDISTHEKSTESSIPGYYGNDRVLIYFSGHGTQVPDVIQTSRID